MKTIIKNVYSFDELNEAAKQKAIEAWREPYDDWSEYIIDDAKEIAEKFGLSIDKIYWSGFWSQGDGACFEGEYKYKKGGLKAIKEYAPNDHGLHVIVRLLQEIQRKNFYRLQATVQYRGRYYHSNCMDISVDREDIAPTDTTIDDITDLLRDFADWIYSRLYDEYYYITADEQVIESIKANEAKFYENGEQA